MGDLCTDSRPIDLLIVGGGPAGMSAASTALAGGLHVALLDAGAALGGQFWRHPAPGAVDAGDHLHHDLSTYRALLAHLMANERAGRLQVLLGHHVWTAAATPTGFAVHALDRSGPVGAERAVTLAATQMLIATGAFDRQLPFPGWDLPGVFTAGGLQSLLKGHGVTAGSRVVVAGTGPFLLPVATGLADSGARAVEICEANSPTRWLRHARTLLGSPAKGAEAVEYAAQLVRHRIPVRTSTAVVAAHGVDRLESVTIAGLDSSGRVRPGSERRVEVDALGVGWGFVPQLDLAITLGARLEDSDDGNQVVAVDAGQRTSVPALLVAGELSGIGGAALAVREGQLAGESALTAAGRAAATSPARLAQVRRDVARGRAFARAMRLAHPVPPAWTEWLTDDTLACRCEEVPVSRVRAAVASGASDARQVKQLTRTGMGWCQGRMCGYAAACLAGEVAPSDGRASRGSLPAAYPVVAATERLVATPVPLGSLARRPSAM